MTSTVFAYLDAGSASAIVTLILGGLAGIGVALKQRWRQFLVFLHIKKPLAEEETQAAAADETARAHEPAEPARR